MLDDFTSGGKSNYSYLLGIYLGDGCLYGTQRSWRLRVTLDLAHPGVIEESSSAIDVIRGRRPYPEPGFRGQSCVTLVSYWKHWPHLFPQHGRGRKHERKIELADWQWEIVEAEPGKFLRGLVHSDGWRGTNRVRVNGKDYEYPRYQFSNRSEDIRKLFTDVCDLLEIAWRPWGRWHISIARREAVAALDEHVGRKY
jgi:hypothetical protein